MNNVITTHFWEEIPDVNNEFYPKNSFCFQKEFFEEISGNFDFPSLVYFMINGKQCSDLEKDLLNLAMVSVSNPGPRSPECRAAMNGAIGKAEICNCVLAGIGTAGGNYRGAKMIENAVIAFNKIEKSNFEKEKIILDIIKEHGSFPGYGKFYGQKDERAQKIVSKYIIKVIGTEFEKHSIAFVTLESILKKNNNYEFMKLEGIFAFIMYSLKISPCAASGIYLMSILPGIIAHSLEQYDKKWFEYPFWWDSKYYHYEK